MSPDPTSGRASRRLLAAFFAVGGALHFVFTTAYVRIIPPWLPAPHALVLISGLCELGGGLMVLYAPLRRVAGMGLIALAIAVWPANLQMLLGAHAAHAALGWQTLLFARLPLQALIILWIWRATLSPGGRR